MNEQTILLAILLSVGAYLSGSIPFGMIFARYFTGTDIRKTGSGNTGMVNTFRAAGPLPAGLTFLFDGLKGFLPVMLAIGLGLPVWVVLFPATLAVAGHNWSIFLKGSGGKGVATSVGVVGAIAPVVALIGVVLWIIIVLSSRYASLGSLMMLGSFPILLAIQGHHILYIIFGVAITMMSIYSHRQNVIRLWQGTELKLVRHRRQTTAETGD